MNIPTPTTQSLTGSPIVKIVFSHLAAQSAEQLSLAAVPLVAVLLLGAGPGEIGLLAAIQTLPFLLLSIPLGALADRTSRRKVMIWGESARAVALVGLLICSMTSLSIAALALLGFVGAVGTVAFSVATPALVPSIVARERLAWANGRIELARSAAFAGGPALAGAMVSWAGAPDAFVLASVLSISAIALLVRVIEPPRAIARTQRSIDDLLAGARFIWADDMLRPVLLTSTCWNLSWFVLQAAYVPYAVKTLGLSARAVGLTLACYGIGMIIGALLAPRVVARLDFGRAIQLGPCASTLAALIMVTTLAVPLGGIAGLAFALFGAGPMIWTITSTTLRQVLTPAEMLGRVSAMFMTASWGARPLGAAIGGIVGSTFGESACLFLALLGFVAQALIILASRVGRLQSLPTTVAPRWG